MTQPDSDVFSLPNEADIHDHDFHQLVVVLDGNTDFDIQGKGKQLHTGEGCILPSENSHAFAGLGDNRIMVINLPIPPQKGITDEEYEIVSRLFDQAAYFQLNPRLQILASALSGELQQYPNDMILARACGNTLLSAIRHQINNKDVRTRGNHLDIDKLDQFNRHDTSSILDAQTFRARSIAIKRRPSAHSSRRNVRVFESKCDD